MSSITGVNLENCSICVGPKADPHQANCNHSFCLECLEDLSQCPDCDRSFTIDDLKRLDQSNLEGSAASANDAAKSTLNTKEEEQSSINCYTRQFEYVAKNCKANVDFSIYVFSGFVERLYTHVTQEITENLGVFFNVPPGVIEHLSQQGTNSKNILTWIKDKGNFNQNDVQQLLGLPSRLTSQDFRDEVKQYSEFLKEKQNIVTK